MQKHFSVSFLIHILIYPLLTETDGFSLKRSFNLNQNNATHELSKRSSCLINQKKFQCTNGQCISNFSICDGKLDCSDRSDEVFSLCRKIQCPVGTFRCAYGACIDGDVKCDGTNDCADNSDELLLECPKFKWITNNNINQCRKNEFQCRDGTCINKSLLCDGRKDCADGSDETVTHCNSDQHFRCPSGSFRCAYGACIDAYLECNNVMDCADGSDEDISICNSTSTTLRPNDWDSTNTITTSTPHIKQHDCTLPAPPKGTTFEYIKRNFVHVKCSKNYVKEIESVMECADSHWLPWHVCLPTCKPLKSITATYKCNYNGAEVNCGTRVRPGTEMIGNCAPGYQEKSQFPIKKNICKKNGNWKFPQYTCDEDCGRIYDKDVIIPQVTYGISTNISKFPWNVGIYENKNNIESFNHICGGTLLSAYSVLTAAHCVTDDSGNLKAINSIKIAVGKYYRDWNIKSSVTQKINVSVVYIPRDFKGVFSNYKYDIAIVELTEAVILSAVVMPICIPPLNQLPKENEKGFIVGWGQDETRGQSEVLKLAILPYINHDNCQKLLEKNKDKVTDDKFCAFIKNDHNVTNVMKGDSGAGFVFQNTLNEQYYIYGIVSTKIDNLTPTFTDINYEHNKDFLDKTHQTVYENKILNS